MLFPLGTLLFFCPTCNMFGPHQKAVRAKGPHPIIFKEQLKLQIFTFHMQRMRQKIISMQFVCWAHLFIRPRPFGEVH